MCPVSFQSFDPRLFITPSLTQPVPSCICVQLEICTLAQSSTVSRILQGMHQEHLGTCSKTKGARLNGNLPVSLRLDAVFQSAFMRGSSAVAVLDATLRRWMSHRTQRTATLTT